MFHRKTLRAAVNKAFRKRVEVHRYPWHRRKNDVIYLSKSEEVSRRQRLQGAYDRLEYEALAPVFRKSGDVLRKKSSFWFSALLLAGTTVGMFPQAARSQETVFVAAADFHKVLAIDPVSNTVITSIPVGGAPTEMVASPDGTRVYVADPSIDSKKVWVIETRTNSVTAEILFGFPPYDVIIAPDGNRGYVSVWGGSSVGSHIKVIGTDPCSENYHKILDTISATDFDPNLTSHFHRLAISPDGRFIYWLEAENPVVYTIDTQNDTQNDMVVDKFQLTGCCSRDLAISPDGSRLYVSHDSQSFGKVSVIDLATREVTLIDVGGGPVGLGVTPFGDRVYTMGGGRFYVISTATNTFSEIVFFPEFSGLRDVAFTRDGHRAYITVGNQRLVVVIDANPTSQNYNDIVETMVVCCRAGVGGVTVAPGGPGGPRPEDFCGGNTPPAVSLNGPTSVPEGQPEAYTFTVSDPDVDDTFSLGPTSCGAAGTLSNLVFDGTTGFGGFDCTYLGGPTVSVVEVEVYDSAGESDVDSLSVEVRDEPPLADAGGPYSVYEGDTVMVTAFGSDPGGAPIDFAWDLDNDGLVETYGQTPVFSAFELDGPSSQTVVLRVCDDDGGCATAMGLVNILNVPPTVDTLTVPVDPVPILMAVELSATFTDPGIPDTHTAVIDWGDGSTDPATVTEIGGSGSVSGEHLFDIAGIYTVAVTVTDKDGDSGLQVSSFVVIYDPGGGFVTGGGWIDSPPGAYPAEPTLTGKANFGFVSKYKKGATEPIGQTEFQFKVADLRFQSSSYDWLVVAGPKAIYKGTGSINGEGDYGFVLSAIDAALSPSTDTDMFRIKIFDKENGDVVVYDNNLGKEDDADPTTAISKGQVAIHTAN